jgi:small-conductance mechanosensitive channel
MVLDTAGRVSEEAKAEALEPEQPAEAAAEASEPQTPKREVLFTPELLATLRWAVPSVWLLAFILTCALVGPQLGFLVAASGVLVLVIALMWSSVQSLTGGAAIGFEEALSMGAPSKVEEEKRSVLRALKDLEYERSVGKISPEDYAELSAKYRAEAKRLIQSLDETLGPARQEVEKSIERRLERAGIAASAPSSEQTAGATEPEAPADAAAEQTPEKPAEKAHTAPETQPEPPEEAS